MWVRIPPRVPSRSGIASFTATFRSECQGLQSLGYQGHRHSASKTASIQVVREPDRVLVEVRDQGHGMSAEKLAEIQSKGSGLGLRGMRERLRHFGGEMIIDSNGTTVLATIPIARDTGETAHRDAQARDSVS